MSNARVGHHDEQGRKLCPKCQVHKLKSEFNPNKIGWDGLQSYCRECNSWAPLWTRHRMRRERYEALITAQGGGCAICGITQCSTGTRFAVDHDHDCCSGEQSCGRCTRGLLCSACNRMIANARDSQQRLQAGIEYLKVWQERAT